MEKGSLRPVPDLFLYPGRFSELFHHSDTANPASLEKETTDKLVQLAFDAADTDTFLLSAELLLESVCQTLFHTSPDATILQAVDALWNYIDQHFTQELDINAYAKEHGYHPVYLISQFSKLKQISPSKRITQKKLALAKELLKNSDMSLQEIVNTVGFYDISYFSRLFKSQEGMTPGAFRKSCQDSERSFLKRAKKQKSCENRYTTVSTALSFLIQMINFFHA